MGPGASAELGDLPSSPYIACFACMQLEEIHAVRWRCCNVQDSAHGSARLAKGQNICHWLITSFLEDHDEYILTIR